MTDLSVAMPTALTRPAERLAPAATQARVGRVRRRPVWLDALVFALALLAGLATGVLLNPPG